MLLFDYLSHEVRTQKPISVPVVRTGVSLKLAKDKASAWGGHARHHTQGHTVCTESIADKHHDTRLFVAGELNRTTSNR
jgi:hypothetical protein